MVRRTCWLGLLLVISGLLNLGGWRAIATTVAASPAPGTAWAWGLDTTGQLGDGTVGSPANVATPGQVVGPTSGTFLSTMTAIAGGGFHSLALKNDGTVWAWGWDFRGQLGDDTVGSPDFSATPSQVSSLTDIIAIAGGGYHNLALKRDGTVWAWGFDTNGQLGDGTVGSPDSSATPSQVGSLTDVVAVAAGNFHSLALKRDGTVWAWGTDASGQLGDGTVGPDNSATPSQVVSLTNVSAIAAGSLHSLALKSDGTVWAWGYDNSGQLGDGTVASPLNSATPGQVLAPGGGFLTDVSAIAGGTYHSLALKGDGTVWAWGYDRFGQLGDGTVGPDGNATPSQVVGPTSGTFLTEVTAIASGGVHSLALKADGTVWTWGYDLYGQLGDDTVASPDSRPTPSQVASLTNIGAIAGGTYHSLALAASASLKTTVNPVTAAYGSTVTLTATLTDGGVGVGGQTITFSLRGTPVGTAATDASGVATLSVSLGTIPAGTYPTGIGAAFAGGGDYAASSGTARLTVLPTPGTVWTWGSDNLGQLGDGTVASPTNRATPGLVVGPTSGTFLNDVIAIAGGPGHSLALKSDGTVWAWGYDASGQLGDGTVASPDSRPTPSQVASLTDVVAIAGAGSHSLALKRDGTVWAWGLDNSGQLGDGTVGPDENATPRQVVGPTNGTFLTDVVAIAAGTGHSLALKQDGTVWTWGDDAFGQLGDGTVQGPLNSATPSRVVAPGGGFLADVIAIAAGGFHSLALKADGTVWAWGTDSQGQLGNGIVDPINGNAIPSQVVGPTSGTVLTNVVAIAGGYDHSLALKADGTVWSWGRDNNGQLGDGTASPNGSATPSQVVSLTNVSAIAGGLSHSLALKQDGTVWTWGNDTNGQLGDGSVGTPPTRATPSQVAAPTGVVAIASACGGTYSLALTLPVPLLTIDPVTATAGSTVTLTATLTNNGTGIGGQTITFSLRGTPVGTAATNASGVATLSVPLGTIPAGNYPTGVVAAFAGNAAYRATSATADLRVTPPPGTVWTWGLDASGQLGDGTVGPPAGRGTPGLVVGPMSGTFLADVVAVAGGISHGLALKADGTVWAWGDDTSGQLGDGTVGTPATSAIPSQVVGLTGVVAIGGRGFHSLALKADGTVWAWGDDTSGQLGDGTVGTPPSRATPGQVVGLTGVVAIAGGTGNSLALKSDGTVWAWGDDTSGQLGDGTVGTPPSRATPSQVVAPGGDFLTGVVAIAGGAYHSLALKGDGTVWAWGNDSNGQLGDGTLGPGPSATPSQVVGLSTVVAISDGGLHSLALKADGTVWAWGDDTYGQLGDGTVGSPASRATPSQVSSLTNVVAIAGGAYHSLALKGDGTVWAWGRNSVGQLGGGSVGSPANSATPSQVVAPGGGFLTTVTAIASRGDYNLALQPPAATLLTTGTTGSGAVSPASGTVQRGAVISVGAVPDAGSLFAGWTVDGVARGWANPLTITMDADHSVVATFKPLPSFGDVPAGQPFTDPVQQLAARGIINGCQPTATPPLFCPDDLTLREQMAALIVRAIPGWVDETGLPTFGDNTADTELMTRVATLQRHNVVRGYQADVCQERGIATPPGCFGPLDNVTYGQSLLFIARAMVEKGYWTLQPDDRTIFPDQNGAANPDPATDQQTLDHRAVVTYVHYVTTVPDVADVHANFALANGQGWGEATPRVWFARAFWPALQSYFGADNVP